MGNLMDAGTLRAGKTPEEGTGGAGEVPRDGEVGHLLSSCLERQ